MHSKCSVKGCTWKCKLLHLEIIFREKKKRQGVCGTVLMKLQETAGKGSGLPPARLPACPRSTVAGGVWRHRQEMR